MWALKMYDVYKSIVTTGNLPQAYQETYYVLYFTFFVIFSEKNE